MHLPAEDHPPGAALQHARDDHVDVTADQVARLLADHHRAVVQMLGDNSTLQLAYGAPIGNSADHVFDGEFRVNFNWYFGGPNQFGPLGQYPPNF